ncbi:menaquinone-dependent protoporphyrinogen IX dehydrogenase [Orbaceae bacterium ac157xtp]
MKILFLYTTHEGQAAKIIHRIRSHFGDPFECDVINLEQTTQIDLTQYQAVMVGTSLRYGYYNHVMKNFINQHHQQISNKVNAFFGVNLVARKANKNTPETNVYTKKFLSKIKWQPQLSAVFAGALYYPRYNWLDKNMIRFIMWLGKGETDVTKPVIEYTDWNKVDEFAKQFLDDCLASDCKS